MIRHNIFRGFIALIILFWTTIIFAIVSPEVQLQSVANRMIQSLEANKSRLSDMNVIKNIVNKNLLPQVDMDRMAASVIGQEWRKASAAQKNIFKKEFANLVTTTYASALSSYDNDRVQFYPLRVDYNKLDAVNVRSVILRSTGQRIPVSYDVVKVSGQWKVYDFSIENVSMIQSYRAQFAGILSSRGFDGLINQLKQHNVN